MKSRIESSLESTKEETKINEKSFLRRMKSTWKNEFENETTPELINAWRIILQSFNDQLNGKEGLLTCDAVCGTGKTTSVQEACGLLAVENPSIGGLIVVRLISQAKEITERINKAARRSVCIAIHSEKGGWHSDEVIRESQFVVITHARYLASVSPSGGKKSFKEWKHGERRLRICDESLDLVERHSLTQKELFELNSRLQGHREFFNTLENLYEKEYDLLKKVARKVGTTGRVMGFHKEIFDDILREYKTAVFLSSFETTIKQSTREDWFTYNTPKGSDSELHFEQWKTETIDYINTFDRIVRYRMCYLDNETGSHRLSTGTFLLPESFESLVVLDATSNVDTIYEYFSAKEVTKYSVPRTVRNFQNARLHFRPDDSGLGKAESTKTLQKRIPQIIKWANTKFTKNDRILFSGHKVLMDALQTVLKNREYPFVDKTIDSNGEVKFKNIDFAHYGAIDGENKWKGYDNLVILSIPFLPKYYSPTAMMALRGYSEDFEDTDDIASSSMAVKIIQLICRISLRTVIDKQGNCPECDIYLLLPGREPFPEDVYWEPLLKRDGPYLFKAIKDSLHNISICNWESFNGFQTKTKNSIPESGVTDSFITWLSTLEPNTVINMKVFEKTAGLSVKQRNSLTAQLSKENSPVSEALRSQNILKERKRGVGTTFIKIRES